MLHKKSRPINFSSDHTKRSGEGAFLLTAFLGLTQTSSDRVVLGGVTFDPCYLKGTLFPQALDEQDNQRLSEQSGSQIAMMIYPAESEMAHDMKPLAATAGWGDGKPEVMRKFDDVFRGLALAIKFQGTSVEALGQTWMRPNLLVLVILPQL